MRTFGKVFSAMAAASLASAPVVAQARDASPVSDSEQLAGGMWLLPLLGLAALLFIIDKQDDPEFDAPTSP